MALTGPGNGPSEATALMAYKLRYEDRKSYRDIAAEMKDPPHRCGNHTTARRWVEAGYRLVHLDPDGMTDPMRKRPVRRETAGDTLDSLFVRIEQEMDAGLLSRDKGRLLQLRALENYIHLYGLRRAPELPRVKRADGSKTAASPVELLHGLVAMQPELDALIERTLPDGRTDP
jgi:hypothetical protein